MKTVPTDIAGVPLAVGDNVLYLVKNADIITFGVISASKIVSGRPITFKNCHVKDSHTSEINVIKLCNVLKLQDVEKFEDLNLDYSPKIGDKVLGIAAMRHKLFLGVVCDDRFETIIAENKFEKVCLPRNRCYLIKLKT